MISGLVDSGKLELLPTLKDLLKRIILDGVWGVKDGETWGELTYSKGSTNLRKDVLAFVHSTAAALEGKSS